MGPSGSGSAGDPGRVAKPTGASIAEDLKWAKESGHSEVIEAFDAAKETGDRAAILDVARQASTLRFQAEKDDEVQSLNELFAAPSSKDAPHDLILPRVMRLAPARSDKDTGGHAAAGAAWEKTKARHAEIDHKDEQSAQEAFAHAKRTLGSEFDEWAEAWWRHRRTQNSIIRADAYDLEMNKLVHEHLSQQ